MQNSKKSKLGLSAITMQCTGFGRFGAQDTRDQNWTNCSDRCDSRNSVKLLELEIRSLDHPGYGFQCVPHLLDKMPWRIWKFLATLSPYLSLKTVELIKIQNMKVLDIFLVFPANIKSAQSEFGYKSCAQITEPNQNYPKSTQLAQIYN